MPAPFGTLLGAAQAEADSKMLRRAFIETPDYQALRHTPDFNYVVGRRGTGKSAIFQRLKEEFSEDPSAILLAEQPQDYEMLELQSLLAPLATEYRVLRPTARLLWTAHLLLDATRSFAKHYRFGKSLEAMFLTQYLARHGVEAGISGTAHCANTLRSILKRSLPVAEIPGALVVEYEIGRLTEALREALDQAGLRVVAMYDRLDEAWSPDVTPVAILGGLAKTASDYREKKFPIYPIVFVRDNMFRALAQMDDDFTRHIEGHSLRLHWDEESLFHLVAARLRVALGLENIESTVKVWNRFAHRELHDREGFAKCLKYTLYRPRDILVLLNEAYQNARRDNREAIVEKDIERTATNISQHRLEDLCKEYDKVLPGVRLFISAFRGESATRPAAAVVAQLENVAQTNDYSEFASRDLVLFNNGGEMFSALYSVGFIGVKDDTSGNYMFCHDGAMAALVALGSSRETLVHPCYWKALDIAITDESEQVVIQVNDEYEVAATDKAVALRLQRLGRIPEDLSGIPEGTTGARDFEAWVLRAVRLLFSGGLTNIELNPNPAAALNQRDVVATNATTAQFWRRIYEDYHSRQVIFECKNYSALTPDDFRQVLDYTSHEYGRFAIIVRRGQTEALTDSEKERTKALFYEHQRLVAVVPTAMLVLCIRKLRTPKKYDYPEFTLSKHMDYIVRSVLSMTHPPRFRQKRKK
jgi:hypothetical protein